MISRALIAIAIATALTGCSVLKTQHPKPYPHNPACRESRGPIVIDFIGAAIGAPVAAVLVYAAADRDGRISDSDDILIGLTLGGWAIGGVGSAVLGMIRTSRCRDAFEKYRALTPTVPTYGPEGAERGVCRVDGSCDPGLTCASNRCVVLPPP
jgi:hypothetical protein